MKYAIKVLDAKQGLITGLGIPYGGPVPGGAGKGRDLEGEWFSGATDFKLDWFPDEGRPALYDHGINPAIKADVIGRQIEKRIDPEVGIFTTVQLNMAHKYSSAILSLVEDGKLGFSSGAMKHLAKVNRSGHIEQWPWVEQTLTTVPANPYSLIPAEAVKHLGLLGLEIPAELGAAMKGRALAAFIENQLPDDDEDRAEMVGRMATAASISVSTVNQIARGEVTCPPLERLEAFAGVLSVSVGALTAAAERDGCEYDAAGKRVTAFNLKALELPDDVSVEDLHQRLRAAIADRFPALSSADGPGFWITAVFDGNVVIERGDDFIQIDFELDTDAAVSLTSEPQTVERRTSFEPAAAPAAKRYSEQAAELLAGVSAFLERSRSLADLRAKDGRLLSDSAYKGLQDVSGELSELLQATEPAAKGLERERLRYEQLRERLRA